MGNRYYSNNVCVKSALVALPSDLVAAIERFLESENPLLCKQVRASKRDDFIRLHNEKIAMQHELESLQQRYNAVMNDNLALRKEKKKMRKYYLQRIKELTDAQLP